MQGLQPSYHIVSDNHYFACGAAALLAHSQTAPVRVRTTLLAPGCENNVRRLLSAPQEQLTLLSVSCIRQRRRVLWFLGRQGMNVLVMAPPGLFTPGLAWLNSRDVFAMPDNVTARLFWPAVRRCMTRKSAAPVVRGQAEPGIIHGLNDGDSVAALSRRLGRPEKAIYNMKNRIMKRTGLTGPHGLILCRDLAEYRELYLAQVRREPVAA